jgi:hypothetical protein
MPRIGADGSSSTSVAEFLSIRSAARFARVAQATLRRAIEAGDLPAYRSNPFSRSSRPHLLVTRCEVLEWKRHQLYVAPESGSPGDSADPCVEVGS